MNMPASRLSQLSRSRLYEKIASILLKRIIKGEMQVGEKLPTERNLALTLEVNRSTVREALKKLESLEVIEIRHGDGVYVKNYLESPNLELINALFYLDDALDTDILMTLLEVRRILVPEMASIAAVNRSEDHIKTLEEIVFHSQDLPGNAQGYEGPPHHCPGQRQHPVSHPAELFQPLLCGFRPSLFQQSGQCQTIRTVS